MDARFGAFEEAKQAAWAARMTAGQPPAGQSCAGGGGGEHAASATSPPAPARFPPGAFDDARTAAWAAMMTRGLQPEEPWPKPVRFDSPEPCPDCGMPGNDPLHQRIQWASMVAASKAGGGPLWQAAAFADALTAPDAAGAPQFPDRSGVLRRLPSERALLSPLDAEDADGPPECQPPEVLVWITDEDRHGGHWACRMPPPQLRCPDGSTPTWVNPSGTPGGGYFACHLALVSGFPRTGPSRCCCPTGLHIEGLDEDPLTHERTYRWSWPYLSPRPVNCAGHSFKVVFDRNWLPHSSFENCEIEWNETSSVPRWVGRTFLPAGRRDMFRVNKYSETFSDWRRWMTKQHAMRGDAPTVELRDSPCWPQVHYTAPGWVPQDPSTDTRELYAEVVVRSGCPDCDDLVLYWAQKVTWQRFPAGHKSLVENYFVADPDRNYGPDPALDSWGTPGVAEESYVEWRARMEQRMARDRAAFVRSVR